MKRSLRGLSGIGVILILLGCLMLSWAPSNATNLPNEKNPVVLYSNQCNDNLRGIFLNAIEESLSSIDLFIYSLSDRKIIQAFQKKALENIKIRLFHDASTSQVGFAELGENIEQFIPETDGLMHKKILVIDKEKVWIGSANFTSSSLLAHDNLVAGLFSKEIASFCLDSSLPSLKTKVGKQKVELWLLPHSSDSALERILSLISSSKKTIKVAMFTWTHQKITDAIIEAHKRGVSVEAVIDTNSGFGSSQKVVEKLYKAGVNVGLSGRSALCHHKMAIIDDEILIVGSANWTRSAFKKNDECFLILFDLTSTQTKKLQKLWHVIRCTKRNLIEEEESLMLSSVA